MSNLIAQSGIPKQKTDVPLLSIPSGNLWNIYPLLSHSYTKNPSGIFWCSMKYLFATGYPQDIRISSATPATRVLQLLRWVVISPCCGLSRSHLAHMEPLRGWSARMVRGWFPGAFCGSHECQNRNCWVEAATVSLVLPGVHNTDRNGSQGQQLSDHLQVQAFLMVAKLTTLPFLGMEVGFHPAQNWHNSTNTGSQRPLWSGLTMPPTNSSAHPKGLHRGTQRAACFPTRTGLPFASRNWKSSGACRGVWLIWVSGPAGPQAPEAERKNWEILGIWCYKKCREFHEIVSDFRTLSFRHAASLAYCPIQSINHHHHHQEQPQQHHHTITNITNSISILEPKIQNLMQTHLVDASSAYIGTRWYKGLAVLPGWGRMHPPRLSSSKAFEESQRLSFICKPTGWLIR